jgi:hypothetical protein
MQELYYSSASSSLQLIKEDKTITNFTVTNLIVCSSLYEIIAFTGSTQLVSFPIENTNLYYSDNIVYPVFSPPYFASTSSVSLTYSVNLTQNALSNNQMTSSGGFIYSGSTYYVSQSNGISNSGAFAVNSGSSYTLLVTGASGASYDAFIEVYDVTTPSFVPIPTDVAIIFQSSEGAPISASFTPSGSHTYNIILSLIGKN